MWVGGEQGNRSGALTCALWLRASPPSPPGPTGIVSRVEERAGIEEVQRFGCK